MKLNNTMKFLQVTSRFRDYTTNWVMVTIIDIILFLHYRHYF